MLPRRCSPSYCHLQAKLDFPPSAVPCFPPLLLPLLPCHPCICPATTPNQRWASLARPRLLEELVPLPIKQFQVNRRVFPAARQWLSALPAAAGLRWHGLRSAPSWGISFSDFYQSVTTVNVTLTGRMLFTI